MVFTGQHTRRAFAGLFAAFLAAAICVSCSRGATASNPGENGLEPSPVEFLPPDPASPAPWLLRGPFPSPAAANPFAEALDLDYLSAEGGELSARPGRVQSAGPAGWIEYGGDPGRVNLLVAFTPSTLPLENCVAYAYREIESEGERELALKVGSDDGIKIWINGVLAYANRVRRALLVDEDAVFVRLAAGKNRVLVKVEQGRGDWGFALRLRELAEDRAEAKEASYGGLRLALSVREAREGRALEGYAMSEPAFCIEGAVELELVDAGGRRLASATAEPSKGFSLLPPPGYVGPCRVVARGKGALEGLSARAWAFAGAAEAFARERAAQARARAGERAGEPDALGGKRNDALGDADVIADTLFFLADLIDGKLPPALVSFDAAMRALVELGELASSRRLPLAGSWRYAQRSAIDGSLQPYSLYAPASYDASLSYGLAVNLHGFTGEDEASIAAFAQAAPRDFLVLAPYARGDLGYAGPAERDVLNLIDELSTRYAIERSRIYLTGSSMGGFGAWRLGRLHPGLFAAIAPFAGWTSATDLDALALTPILAVHGDQDQTVPPGPDAAAVATLSELGGSAVLDLLPGAGHDAFSAWTAKEGADRLLDWFRGKRVEIWPRALSVRTSMAKYGENRWARVLGLSRPLVPAGLDARIADSRHIAVDTDNVSAFELDLAHPLLAKNGRILLLVDGINLTADAGRKAVFALGTGERFKLEKEGARDPGSAARDSGVAAGAGGAAKRALVANGGSGLAALFEGPLRIVYGTRVSSRVADLRAAAEALADWTTTSENPKGQGLGAFLVQSDAEAAAAGVTEDEGLAKASLILVGSPEDNALVARIASRLPVAFERGRVEVGGRRFDRAGALLICPDPEDPGRLVAILSPPPKASTLAALARKLVAPLRDYTLPLDPAGGATPDLIVFDGSGAKLGEASFDREWKRLIGLDTEDEGGD